MLDIGGFFSHENLKPLKAKIMSDIIYTMNTNKSLHT